MLINPKTANEQGWIKNIEVDQIQPNAIDFTLDKAFTIGDGVFLLHKDGKKQHREQTELQLMSGEHLADGKEVFAIPGKTSIDCMSNAYVEIPEGVAAKLIIRSTLNRNGIFLTSGLYDSGYKGPIGFVLHNLSGGTAFIEKGACVGQIEFYASDSEGKYKGGYNSEEGNHWTESK